MTGYEQMRAQQLGSEMDRAISEGNDIAFKDAYRIASRYMNRRELKEYMIKWLKKGGRA